MALPTFKPSKKVQKLVSGRTRDDSYDAPVQMAYAEKGKVFEATVPADEVDEVRKGLQRSALYLKVRVTSDFQDNGDGTWTVYFSANDKMPRNGSRKPVENADAPTGDVENATVNA